MKCNDEYKRRLEECDQTHQAIWIEDILKNLGILEQQVEGMTISIHHLSNIKSEDSNLH